jgi:phage N-6-adenine-methyltransferase
MEPPDMALNAALFSSETDDWATPMHLFRQLDYEFHFETDVCASPDNAKCEHFFTKEQDGLQQDWLGTCWMNPPYGETINKWMQKAYESSQQGATVVCLVPARTDTAWWHDWAMKGEIRFLRGRIKFGGAKDAAPFPSALVIFRGRKEE